MAINLTVNGVSFNYPTTGDQNWGIDTTNWANAVTGGMLQKAGGVFTLTADVDFGVGFGLKSNYFSSRSLNTSATGQVRLANTDSLSFRNTGNTADLALKPDSDGILQYNSIDLVNLSAAQTLTNKTISGTSNTITGLGYSNLNLSNSILNSDINSAAAIAYSKLNLAGAIINSDVNAAAAIAYSKLNLAASIVNSDVSATAAVAYSKLNLASSIINSDISASAAVAYSKLSLTASIVNADVSATAAIAYSKLNLATSILNSDISATAAIAYSKLNLAASIVNADVSATAAIAYSKLNLSNSIQTADLTANSVTTAKLAQAPANTIRGNNTGATANVADLTVSQVLSLIGPIPIANGGTGAATLTANNVLLGNGTSSPQFVAPGSIGNVLVSNGATWTSAAPSATVNVNAGYYLTTAQSVANSVLTILKFDTVDYDTNSAYNTTTGVFTVPAGGAGKYRCSFQYGWAFAAVFTAYAYIYQNGAQKAQNFQTTDGSNQKILGISKTLNCAVGDTIDFRVQQNNGAINTISGLQNVYMNIERVGN